MASKVHYSPHVVGCLTSASGLASQLRSVINKLEGCQASNMPVPVNLAKRAQVLLNRVDILENKDVVQDNVCPMRFTPQIATSSTSPDQVPGSNTKWGMPNSANNRSSGSMLRKMKNRYKSEWENMQRRQNKLYEAN